MADIADLAQKIAFYQAGGKDPGTDTLDKVNTGIGVVDKAIKDVLATKKAQYDNQKTLAETKKLQTENSPVTEVLGTPAVKSQILAAENAPIPAQDLISGRLDTRQAGIDAANKTAHSYQNTFGNATVGQTEDLAKADLAKAQAEYYRSGQKGGDKKYIDVKTRELFDAPGPNRILVPNSTAATIASGIPKEEALLGRQKEMERINVEPSTKIRYNELRSSLRIAENLEQQLRWAKQNNINLTGLLNSPISQFREYMGTLPKDQQEILTNIRRNFASFGRKMGGTAFTETEKGIFGPITPQLDLPVETNLNRIGSTIEELNGVISDEEQLSPGLKELYLGGGKPAAALTAQAHATPKPTPAHNGSLLNSLINRHK